MREQFLLKPLVFSYDPGLKSGAIVAGEIFNSSVIEGSALDLKDMFDRLD